MNKILIILEDEMNLSGFIRLKLEQEGYEVEVEVAMDGKEGLVNSQDREINLFLLILPIQSGIEVCKLIRADKDTPIIMINSQDNQPDRISALDSGVDFYISEPFHIEELLARIRAVFRGVERRNRRNTHES